MLYLHVVYSQSNHADNFVVASLAYIYYLIE